MLCEFARGVEISNKKKMTYWVIGVASNGADQVKVLCEFARCGHPDAARRRLALSGQINVALTRCLLWIGVVDHH